MRSTETTPYETSGTLRLARRFVAAMWRSLRWRLVGVVGVSVALALTEGAGLVLLVPLLAAIGLVVNEGPIGALASAAGAAFALAGLTPTLPVVLLVFVGLSAAYAAVFRWHMLLAPATEQRFTLSLRNRLYEAVISAQWPFLVQRRATDLAHALTADIDRVSTAAFQLLRLAATLGTTVVYVAVAARLSFALTAAAAAGSLVVLWLLRGRTRHSTECGAASADAERRLEGMVHESLAALKVTKTSAAEAPAIAAHATLTADASARHLDLVRSFARTKHRTDIISAVALAALLFAAASGFRLRGASLLLLMFVFSRIVPRMLSLQESVQLCAAGLPAFARVADLVDACERASDAPGSASTERLDLSQDLRVEGVRFAYPGGAMILQGIDVEVPAGQFVAVVGPSGAGKSTLADVIVGLLTPESGRVLVDGLTLTPSRLAGWRRSIGYVGQDTFLLHDTIRANLMLAAPAATERDIERALEMAGAALFVAGLPAGLDTTAGDRGVRLSGGERQRIALARALLRRPSLLILDEATSALDGASERQILDAIARLRGRMTILMITHRLAAVRDADRVYVLDRGRVEEAGTWTALAAAPDSLFRRLWDAQHAGSAEGWQVA